MMHEVILAAAHDLPELSYDDGVEVLTEGVHDGRLLILTSGAVDVTRDGTSVSVIDQQGAVLGEVAALLNTTPTATVRSRGKSTFRVSYDPHAFFQASPGVALDIAVTLARRLDALTKYLADIKQQYADRDSHLGLVDVVLESLSVHQGATAEVGSDREPEAPY
jgi:CRP-like cAMP-binding protein